MTGNIRSVGRMDGWMSQQVILDFVDEEHREHDYPVGLAGLRRCRHVFAVDAVVGLGDADPAALEVEVGGRERQRLAAAHSQPVQHLEDHERDVLVHDRPGEPLVLVLDPEAHLVGLLAAHSVDLAHGVTGKVVKADGMVEHCRQLVADGSQVGVLVGKAVGRGPRLYGVLPAEDVQRRYVCELLLAQVGEDFGLDELLLSALGGDAHLLGDVVLVQLVERVERHVRRSLHLPQEVHFPGCSGLLRLESALGLLLAFPRPIAVVALDVVGAALVVLTD